MRKNIGVIISFVTVFILIFYFVIFETTDNDKYKNFEELASVEIEKEDYTIHTQNPNYAYYINKF